MDQEFERMTVKRQDGRWALANNDGASNLEQMEKLPKAIARLAAYEDTGLTPEEIDGLCKMDKRAKMAKMLRWEEAERDGRLVMLPASCATISGGSTIGPLQNAVSTAFSGPRRAVTWFYGRK